MISGGVDWRAGRSIGQAHPVPYLVAGANEAHATRFGPAPAQMDGLFTLWTGFQE